MAAVTQTEMKSGNIPTTELIINASLRLTARVNCIISPNSVGTIQVERVTMQISSELQTLDVLVGPFFSNQL